MNIDRGNAIAAFHYHPGNTMQSGFQPAPAGHAPATAKPANPNIVANVALFTFAPRDGQTPRPNSPTMTGSLQLSHEQVSRLAQWMAGQQPDAYGKVKLNVSVWNQTSRNGQRYLQGNIQFPLQQPTASPQQLQQAQWSQQTGQVSPATGQPIPAVTTEQAYQSAYGQQHSYGSPAVSANQQPTPYPVQATPQSGQPLQQSVQQPLPPMTQPMPSATPSPAQPPSMPSGAIPDGVPF